MAAITSAVIAIAGVILGWIAIEVACTPCLERGREAIDRSLNPDYDPDDNAANVRHPEDAAAESDVRSPLISTPSPDLSHPSVAVGVPSSDPYTAIKSI